MWATYILGPIFTLLPRRWREKIFRTTPNRLARAATLSGIFEALLALVALLIWYSIYVRLAGDALAHSSAGSDSGGERMGLFAYVWFWLNPITWLVAYFGVEGVLRSVAALSARRVVRNFAVVPGRTTLPASRATFEKVGLGIRVR